MRLDERLNSNAACWRLCCRTRRSSYGSCLLYSFGKVVHHIEERGSHLLLYIAATLSITNNLRQTIITTDNNETRVLSTVNDVERSQSISLSS